MEILPDGWNWPIDGVSSAVGLPSTGLSRLVTMLIAIQVLKGVFVPSDLF